MRWRTSNKAKREFAKKMNEIDQFCFDNGISQSRSSDSYYFTIEGKAYRVSNHSIEASNAHAYNWMGEKIRDKYHDGGREADVTYIHAGKTRIIEIYTDLKNGFALDGRGRRV